MKKQFVFLQLVWRKSFVRSCNIATCFVLLLKLRLLVHFKIIGKIHSIETIAVGKSIRELTRLRKQYGPGRWRKMKGVAKIRLANERIRTVELHLV